MRNGPDSHLTRQILLCYNAYHLAAEENVAGAEL